MDKLSTEKIKAGFEPDATLDDLMMAWRCESERLTNLTRLIDGITAGEFARRQGFITGDGLVICAGCADPEDERYDPTENDDWCSVCDVDLHRADTRVVQ